VADPGGGPDQWQYSGGGGLAYYVDPSFGAGGDGSYASPWDDFTEINALSAGDLDGATIAIKSGETVYDSLLMANQNGFTVTTYGGASPGIIDGSIPTGFTWTREGATDFWYATSASQVAIYVGDIAYEMAQSNAVLSDSVFQRAQQTYYFGVSTVNAGLGSKMWVHVLPGVNMATEEAAGRVRKPNADSYAFDMQACSGQTLNNIQVQRGSYATLRASEQGDGFTATNCVFRQNGFAAGTGQDLVNLKGVSGSDVTNTIFSGCTFEDNFGGTNCNATEFAFVDGVSITDCTYNRILGNAVELWEDCDNVVVDRCQFVDIGSSILWLSNDDGGVNHDNIIRNCTSVSLGNSRSDSGTNQGSVFVKSESASNTLVYNNTHVSDVLNAIRLQPSSDSSATNTITIKNNLFINSHDNGDSARIQTYGSVLSGDPAWTFVNTLTGAKNEIVSDYNSFYSYRQAAQSGVKMGNINGVATSGLAAWQAQTGTPDLHSYEVDQGVANPWGAPSGTTTTLTAGVSTGAWAIVVASLTGISVGTWVTHTSRVASVDTATNTCNLECRFGSAAASGKLVTILSSPLAVLTPANTPPLNSGIGSATDANVPTVDFYGNARSTTAPDIGAVEV
jgi:hypothetical protein